MDGNWDAVKGGRVVQGVTCWQCVLVWVRVERTVLREGKGREERKGAKGEKDAKCQGERCDECGVRRCRWQEVQSLAAGFCARHITSETGSLEGPPQT